MFALDQATVIPALDGAPGVYSADWAETPKGRDFHLAMDKVEQALIKRNIKTRDINEANQKQFEELKCNFTCLLSLCLPDGKIFNFEGRVFGHLTFPVRGEAGFGYDPLFTPLNGKKTFAEMIPADKYAMSHRAEAFKKFKAAIFNDL